MRPAITAAVFFLSCLACGPASTEDPCGLGLELPDLGEGSARYQHNGTLQEFNGGGYRLGFPHDLVMGSLTLNAKQDRDRRLVQDLIDTDSFPICVPLDDQADGSGYAFIEDGNRSFMTTASYTGTLAILAMDSDILVGRFSFDAIENAGSQVAQIRDGAFRLRPR